MISRRTFLTALGASVSTFAVTARSRGFAAPSAAALDLSAATQVSAGHLGSLMTESLTFALRELPAAFNGYKIGFLSDLHLGIWMPENFLTSALQIVRDAKCDLLILGGDYIGVPENPIWEKSGFVWNESFAGLSKQRVIAKIFSRMNEMLGDYTFPDGILAVAGNHEHWNSTKAFLEVFKSSRFCKLLVNEWHSITRENISLDVFGADDFLTGIPHLPSARSSNGSNNSRDSAPKSCQILVSHNPDLVSYGLHRDGERFPFSLSLSGHTHGGQVRVPGIGALTYQVFDRRFGEGRVEMFGKHTYTSRGVGVVSVPFRLDCPPEVTLITLATPSS